MDETPDSAHRRAWDLIPWLVAGSASNAERQLVEQHAAACADCRAELAFHRQLHEGMTSAPAAPAPEPALARLWQRIDQADLQPVASAAPQAAPPALGVLRHRWTGLLVAAVVLQAIGLAALLGMLWERPSVADYQTLSRAVPSSASIRLVPATTLQLGELQALLARSGLQVVESSGDGAILGLAPRPGSAAATGEIIVRLRAEPGVLLAEPILPAATAGP